MAFTGSFLLKWRHGGDNRYAPLRVGETGNELNIELPLAARFLDFAVHVAAFGKEASRIRAQKRMCKSQQLAEWGKRTRCHDVYRFDSTLLHKKFNSLPMNLHRRQCLAGDLGEECALARIALDEVDDGVRPCGSVSMISTFSPTAASAVPRLMAVVVLPTPPFWLATASTRNPRPDGFGPAW